jgi:hypothetical protein
MFKNQTVNKMWYVTSNQCIVLWYVHVMKKWYKHEILINVTIRKKNVVSFSTMLILFYIASDNQVFQKQTFLCVKTSGNI